MGFSGQAFFLLGMGLRQGRFRRQQTGSEVGTRRLGPREIDVGGKRNTDRLLIRSLVPNLYQQTIKQKPHTLPSSLYSFPILQRLRILRRKAFFCLPFLLLLPFRQLPAELTVGSYHISIFEKHKRYHP
jgi:hypothetical protein